MKRTVVKKVIIVVVVLFLVVMGVQVLKKLQHKEQVQQALAILPDFNFYTLEGASFTNAQLPQNNKIVFIYFNTECEYCFYETKDISLCYKAKFTRQKPSDIFARQHLHFCQTI